MKKFSIRLFLMAVAFMAALLTGCSSDSDSDSENETYYTVNFYGNYGDFGLIGYSTASAGATITASPNVLEQSYNAMTRKGFHLKGWSEDKDASEATYTPSQSVKVEKDMNLYAVWEKIESFTITYDAAFIAAEASESEKKTQTVTVKNTDEKVALITNTFTREGYVVTGWATSASSKTVAYYDGAETDLWDDTTLYALWGERSSYIQVTFNKNDGSAESEEKIIYVKKNTSFTLPVASFTREGYTFSGWAKSSSSTKYASAAAGEEKSLSESTSDYYAIWASSSVTVNFDPNSTYGGSGNSFTQNLVFDSSILKYSGSLPENSFTSEKGNFVGWYVSQKPSSGELIMEAGKNIEITLSNISSYTDGEGKITLYAIWNSKSYTVTYNTLGNGENILDVVTNTAEYGEAMSYTVRTQAAESAYDYYTFQGWGQYPTSTSYIDGNTVSLSGDKTIYAVWKLGTIGESSGKEIKSGNYIAIPFTLLKNESISVDVKSDDTDTDLQMYLVDSENYELFKANETFSYKTAVSSDSGTYSLSASAAYPSGSYYISLKTRQCLKSTQSPTQ